MSIVLKESWVYYEIWAVRSDYIDNYGTAPIAPGVW